MSGGAMRVAVLGAAAPAAPVRPAPVIDGRDHAAEGRVDEGHVGDVEVRG